MTTMADWVLDFGMKQFNNTIFLETFFTFWLSNSWRIFVMFLFTALRCMLRNLRRDICATYVWKRLFKSIHACIHSFNVSKSLLNLFDSNTTCILNWFMVSWKINAFRDRIVGFVSLPSIAYFVNHPLSVPAVDQSKLCPYDCNHQSPIQLKSINI